MRTEGQPMSECASHYPISILLARIVNETSLSRSDFIEALGYRNIDRGRRRLDAWMDTGEGYERILKQIVTAFPLYADEIREAVAATAAVKAAEWDAAFYERCKAEEATFRPYLHADG